jgi:hypothetical protein
VVLAKKGDRMEERVKISAGILLLCSLARRGIMESSLYLHYKIRFLSYTKDLELNSNIR